MDPLPTIAEATHAMQAGKLSPVELVETCLQQIDHHDAELQAWVLVDRDGAQREAEQQAARAQRGEWSGPLHGIPVGIKDIIDVAGWPTECGSVLRAGRVAKQDAELVRRLRQAGAILLGKTVTTQFASFDPPPTRNPWNLERTPGGSSSGSAAAVAAEMCLAAVGTQTGGSICRPAAYCGIVGFKPTFDSVSLAGVEPLSWHLDHAGPLARTVADARMVWEVLTGATHVPPPALPTPRLRRLRGFFNERLHPDVLTATNDALERLIDADANIESQDDRPWPFAELLEIHRCIMSVEAAAHHREAFSQIPELFGPRIRDLVEGGLRTTAVDYAAALRRQRQIKEQFAELFADDRLLILSATTTTAPGLETTGDPAFNSIWSFAGCPEITIPCGLGPDGLPCGIQVVGPVGRDAQVLAAAEWCEAVLAFRERPALLGGTTG